MKSRSSELAIMLTLSVAFTLVLLAARIVITRELMYLFYVWNLFLAVIPLLFSSRLHKLESFGFKAVLLLTFWLLFFPNAPYIITDIFHFTHRPPVPKWVDLLLVISAAWNGLILGLFSLMQVEKFLLTQFAARKVNLFISFSLLLCAYGIYLGRFLRFNSWNVLTAPHKLFDALLSTLLHPHQNMKIWAFTVLFGSLLWLIYYTIKKMSCLAVATK